MSITSILRDTNNNVSLVRMISTDSLSAIASANYVLNNQVSINELNSGAFGWFTSDMLLVAASDGNALFTFTDSTFSTLKEYSGSASGDVNPGLANQLGYYATTGSTISGLTSANNAVLLTNGSGVPAWVATDSSGFLLSENNLSDVDDAATSRINLGLGTMATQNASAVAITGGNINGTAIGGTTASTGIFTTATALNTLNIGNASTAGQIVLFSGTNASYYLSIQPNPSQTQHWTLMHPVINGNDTYILQQAVQTIVNKTYTLANLGSLQTSDNSGDSAYISVFSGNEDAYVNMATLTNNVSGLAQLTFSQPTGSLLNWSGGYIGVLSPVIAGIFNVLEWLTQYSTKTANYQIAPATDLGTTFEVTNSGVIISTQAFANYSQGFRFDIKNTSNGVINFTPNSPDTIEGASTLVINIGECYTISASPVSGEWEVLSNYNTASDSGYLLAANNLNDVSSISASRNNLQVNNLVGFNAANTNVTLANPCPTWYTVASGVSANTTITMPVMNSTTPGSKSLGYGQFVTILNQGSGTVTLLYNSGASISGGTIPPGCWTQLVNKSSGTSDGLFDVNPATMAPTFTSATITGALNFTSNSVQVWQTTAASQSISNATFTAIQWTNTQWLNPSTMWSSGSNTRLVAPATGKYQLSVTVQFNATTSLGETRIQVYKNGSFLDAGTLMQDSFTAIGSQYWVLNCSDNFLLSATDYLEVYVYQSSGGTLTITPTRDGQTRATLTMISS